MAIDPQALQNMLNTVNAASAQQNAALQQSLQNNATAHQNLLNFLNNQNAAAVTRITSLEMGDLPKFGGFPYEDAQDFLTQFETMAVANNFTPANRIQHFALCLRNNALRWYTAEPAGITWPDLRSHFLTAFGKTRFELDLMNEGCRTLAFTDPRTFVHRVLDYVEASNPAATEAEKTVRLFEALPLEFKPAFVTNSPRTVADFFNRLRDVSVKQQYKLSLHNQNSSYQLLNNVAGQSSLLSLNSSPTAPSSNQIEIVAHNLMKGLDERLKHLAEQIKCLQENNESQGSYDPSQNYLTGNANRSTLRLTDAPGQVNGCSNCGNYDHLSYACPFGGGHSTQAQYAQAEQDSEDRYPMSFGVAQHPPTTQQLALNTPGK
ncbi:uncharacterized protein LOC129584259 [Paramacrobiotus metropolitanus]|uniref:uncharacterized protein LOC129584259 n=1 Tax=Paramacrobiotus metropolitanus TaxID=2943436 RepID=UPI0024461CBD|nr:uncharacterized protein LOC129584259 [Paramacrobiotus metropolitanus]XP_055332354.1 uncharacterized protein LOC129584259 [Paramacrobiotus metropolitanus]